MKKFDDKTSHAILRTLRENSRISWQELGKAVYLSGQAAAERVKQMQEHGIIRAFTIKEKQTCHYIGISMQHTDFERFEKWVTQFEEVESLDKVSGDICYMLVYVGEDREKLESFLNQLLEHGAYRLNSSIRQIK